MIPNVIRDVSEEDGGHIGLLLTGWKKVKTNKARKWSVCRSGEGSLRIGTRPEAGTGFGGSSCCCCCCCCCCCGCCRSSASDEERGGGEGEEREETEDAS